MCQEPPAKPKSIDDLTGSLYRSGIPQTQIISSDTLPANLYEHRHNGPPEGIYTLRKKDAYGI